MNLSGDKTLDIIGWHILREMQENARLSFAELGRKVGLSTPAVMERVRKLEDAGIITGYHAEINAAKVNLPITAFVRLSVVGNVYTKFIAALEMIPEITECYRTTGADSVIMKVTVASVTHLETLIDQLMPYGTTTTSMVLSTPLVRHVIEPIRKKKNGANRRR
ncbi:MAG: Lrp/AsnC family transcriptional regulator [Pyrinomonadaceae bacterium]